MPLTEMESGPTVARQPEQLSGTIVEFMNEGFAIEKDPTPAGAALILHESDRPVTGEDLEAVVSWIKEIKQTEEAEETPAEITEPVETERGLGHNTLMAARRHKLGIYAVTAITAAGAFFAAHTGTAKANTEPVGGGINVPTQTGGVEAGKQNGSGGVAADSKTAPAHVRGKTGVGNAREASNGIHYLMPQATFSDMVELPPTSIPPPTEITPPTVSNTGSETDPGTTTAPRDIKELMQTCTEEALAHPKILRPIVMYHAGNRPAGHFLGQRVGGVLGYKEMDPPCAEARLKRVSRGHMDMLREGEWKVSVSSGFGWPYNDAGKSHIAVYPPHSFPAWPFNYCPPGKDFNRVRLVMENALKQGISHGRNSLKTIAKDTYAIEIDVRGNCKQAERSLELAEKRAAAGLTT